MLITIVGKGFGWELAPPANNGDNVWGACQLNTQRDVDVVVDMNEYSDNRWGETESLMAELSKSIAKDKGTPYIDLSSYPIDQVIDYFGTDFFTNTIDYMIALAIYRGATEIHFYGVNMTMDDEYSYQRPGVHFWIGMAMGRGIKIRVFGKDSTILKTPDGILYGYDIKQKEINYELLQDTVGCRC